MTQTPPLVTLYGRAAAACHELVVGMEADDNLRAPARLLAMAFEKRAAPVSVAPARNVIKSQVMK